MLAHHHKNKKTSSCTMIIQNAIDCIPPKHRKSIKQFLGVSKSQYTTIQRNHSWILNKAYALCKKELSHSNLKSNVPVIQSKPILSHCITAAINRLSEKSLYSFHTMLVIMNPFGLAPLTAMCVFNTETACKVRYTIQGDIPETSVSETTLSLSTKHQIPIWGLYPGKANSVHLELLDENNKIIDSCDTTITTGTLPKLLKNNIRLKQHNETSAHPFTFITGGLEILPCIVDAMGSVRYYISTKPKGYGVFLLSDNRFLFPEGDVSAPTLGNPHANQIQEMDFWGRTYHTYYIPKGIHHNAIEKEPNGNILACASSLYDGHIENAVVEFDRTTGKIIKELNLASCFDDTYKDRRDWAHINSLTYNKKENTIMVSLRNLHSIAKIDWSTNEMVWLLGNPEFWKNSSMKDKLLTPDGNIKWFYQQHAVTDISSFYDDDTCSILLFDNHWHKRRSVDFFDNDPNSYLTIFHIDEKHRTVTMESATPSPKSIIRSNAVLYPEKNRIFSMCGYLKNPDKGAIGKILELDYSSSKIINECFIKKGFFAAYPFLLNYDKLAIPMKKETNYLLGTLNQPVLIADSTVSSYVLDTHSSPLFAEFKKNADYYIEENILFIKAIDHAIEKIIFKGKRYTYETSFEDTKQENSKFAAFIYYIMAPFHDLKPDKYQIYIVYKSNIFALDKYITIVS